MEYETIDGECFATDHGTASAIDAHTLVTAAHVITPTPKYMKEHPGAKTKVYIEHELGWLRCEVTKIDTARDIAILVCSSVTLKFAQLNIAVCNTGEQVTLWSSV